MKAAEEWYSKDLNCIRGRALITVEQIRAIQADALWHAFCKIQHAPEQPLGAFKDSAAYEIIAEANRLHRLNS